MGDSRDDAKSSRIVPEPGGRYSLLGLGQLWYCGQGPWPDWRPTRVQLREAGINPDDWARWLYLATNLDLREALGSLANRFAYTTRPQPSKLSHSAPVQLSLLSDEEG